MKNVIVKLLSVVLISCLFLTSINPMVSAKDIINMNLYVYDLSVNGMKNGSFIDKDNPVLSWKINADKRGTFQTAYQIIVYDNDTNESVYWDSGKITSSLSSSVNYNGTDLKSANSYSWKVKIWDNFGNESEFSAFSEFHTGLKKTEWTADYIWDGFENVNNYAYFRKNFTIENPVKSVVVYVSAHNDYQLYFNGNKTGVGPARSDPYNYGQYNSYDITEQIVQGENSFAALAHWHGAWNDSGTNGKPAFIMEARIKFQDGTTKTIKTDSTWKTQHSTPYIESNPIYFGHYGGEKNRTSIKYDARLEKDDWNKVVFDDSQWKTATIVNRTDYNLYSQRVGDETEMERKEPVSVTKQNDKWIVDFGKCLTGWPEIKIHNNQAGNNIKVQYWEVQKGWGDAGYDSYICKGGEEKFYAPYVRHTSFRILEISGYNGTLTADDVRGIVAYSYSDKQGSFESSDTRLNSVYEMCERSGRQNFQQGIISVDANREQSPWTADSWNIGIGYLYNHAGTMAIDKILKDYANEQLPSGNFLTCSPAKDYNSQIVEWSMYWPMLLWQQYLFSGDTKIISDYYKNLTDFLNYLNKYKSWVNGLFNPPEWRLSDYAGGSLQSGGQNIATNSQVYINLTISSQIAEVLGKTDDANKFKQQAVDLKRSINQNLLVDGEKYKTTPTSSQIHPLGTAWALRADVVPDAFKKRVIIWMSKATPYDIGGYGGDALYNGLYSSGLGKTARDDFARYENMLNTNGTNWESFGQLGIDNMGNHAWTAYPSYILQKYAGGISPTAGGFFSFEIKPVIDGLIWVKTKVPTVKGNITTECRKNDDSNLTLTASIPANSNAKIYVPNNDMSNLTIKESGNIVFENGAFSGNCAGITSGVEVDGYVAFDAGSGEYSFEVLGTPLHSPEIDTLPSDTPYTLTEELQMLVFQMSKVDTENCINPEIIAQFKAAIENASLLIENPSASEEQINAAMDLLNNTYAEVTKNLRINLALNKPVTASEEMVASGYWDKSYLTDGYKAEDNNGRIGYTTKEYYSKLLTKPIDITIDLKGDKEINTVELYPRISSLAWNGKTANFPEDYEIQISSDNKSYKKVYSVTGQKDPEFQKVKCQFKKSVARYVRIHVTKLGEFASDEGTSNAHRLQLSESEIYNETAHYNLSVNYNKIGGTVTGNMENIKDGDQTTLFAQPIIGWEFKGWFIDNQKVNEHQSYTLVVDDNIILTALFEKVILPQTVTISASKKTITIGEKLQLVANILPENATYKKVIWSTQNANASVSDSGLLTGLKSGTVEITATTVSGNIKGTITLTVANPLPVVAGVAVPCKKIYVVAKNKIIIPAVVYTKSGKAVKATFSSSNTKAATITKAGRLTAIKTGKTIITIKAGNKSTKLTVYVVKKSVRFKRGGINGIPKGNVLYKNKSLVLSAKISPSKATGIIPIWSSSNSKIIVVDVAGKITAKSKGKATIKLKLGMKSYKVTIKVS